MKRLGKRWRKNKGEPEASVTSFFSSSFYGAFQRRLVLRGWGGELLRRDVVDKRKRKKEAYSPAGTYLQGFAHRYNYSCKSEPVGEYLQVLAPQTFSPRNGTTSATTST